MGSFAVFGGAFFMRPVGGILLGYVGDRYGRKRALEISIALMLLPSLVMGMLPTYEQIGLTASFIIVLIRLCQGVAVGGELVGSILYMLIETWLHRHRG